MLCYSQWKSETAVEQTLGYSSCVTAGKPWMHWAAFLGGLMCLFRTTFCTGSSAFSDPRSGLVLNAPLRQHRWYWYIRDMEKKLSAAIWGSDVALFLFYHLNLSPLDELPWLLGEIQKQISHTVTSRKEINISVWNLYAQRFHL